jgi:hypothetical protein
MQRATSKAFNEVDAERDRATRRCFQGGGGVLFEREVGHVVYWC